MLRVDKSGSYKFSDITGNKQAFLDDFQDAPSWIPNAANAIYKRFRGKTVLDTEVYKFLIAETPFPKRKAILEYLEKSSPPKITNVLRPQKSTRGFPDGCSITFSNSHNQQLIC